MRPGANPDPPNLLLRMIRLNLDDIPVHDVPAGYSIRGYEHGDDKRWTAIQRASERFLPIDDTTFATEFGDDDERLRDRCFFVVTDDGDVVGTVTAWEGPFVPYDPAVTTPTDLRALLVAKRAAQTAEPWGMLSWFAVRPDHQGRGVARPLLTAMLQRLARDHTRCWALTSTGRPASVHLQIEFGFRPDLAVPQTRAAWQISLDTDPALGRFLAADS